MAKYKRYRKYSRRYHPKWSPNISQISTTSIAAAAGSFHFNYTLCTNAPYTQGTVTQANTVKNMELTFYIDSADQTSAIYIEDVTAYIVYVPEGYSNYGNLPFQHPEWILAYKFLGSPSTELSNTSVQGQQYQPTRIKSRLARKLQSGDSIHLLILGTNTYTSTMHFDIHGLIRWWTKAN